MRVIGIDYGLKRTGIAIADTAGGRGMALPFEMFEGLSEAELARAVADLVKAERAQEVVVGLPLNADGTASPQSKLTEHFIDALQQRLPAALPIRRISEYLSTHDAEGKLAGHFTRQQKRQRIDALAAARILQDYLDQNSAGEPQA